MAVTAATATAATATAATATAAAAAAATVPQNASPNIISEDSSWPLAVDCCIGRPKATERQEAL